MSSRPKLSAYRDLNYGLKVERATAVLPATGAQTIFNVSGGRVSITALVGEFTVVGSATSTTVKVNAVPTVGPAADISAASAAFTTQAVGSLVSITGIPSDAALVGGTGVAPRTNGVIVPAGAVQITTSATNTGSVRWTATYCALDDGAVLTAA